MLAGAVDYVVRRGINDAYRLTDVSELANEWPGVAESIVRGRKRAMEAFCGRAEEKATATPERDDRFLTPKMLVERTRLALRLIDTIESSKKPEDLNALAKKMEVDGQKLRDLLAALFIVPEPTIDHLLTLCQEPSEEERKGQTELTDKYGLHEALLFSLTHGRLPNDEEARRLGAKNAEALKKHVQNGLKKDLHEIADRFWKAGFNVNDVVLNRYSFYYREYGFDIYQLWFGKNMNSLFNFLPAPAQKTLKKSLQRGEAYSRKNPMHWGRVSNEFITQLNQTKDRAEMMQLIEEELGIKFTKTCRKIFKEQSAKELLEFWNAFDIPCVPLIKWFTVPPEKIGELKNNYAPLLELMGQWAFPLHEQVKILHGKITVESLEEKIATLLDQGLSPEYFLPYVTHQKNELAKDANRMIGTVCDERRMRKAKERLEVPGQGIDMTYGTQDTVEALMYLDRIGFSYDGRVPLGKKRVYSPESIAIRARILEGIPMRLKMNQLVKSPATLRSRLPMYKEGRKKNWNVDYKEGDYEKTIEERNLKPPAWCLNLVGKVSFVARIRDIEAKGIPCTEENRRRHFWHWSWINLGPRELDRKIEKTKRRMTRSDSWQELCEEYGIAEEHLPTALRKNKTPEHAWEYLLFLESVDLKSHDIALSTIQTHSLPRFRDEFAYRFRRERKKGEKLTPNQDAFLAQYAWADQAREKWGWKEAHDWCVLLNPKELRELSKLVGHPQAKSNHRAVKEWQQLLQERAKNQKEVMKALIQLPGTYRSRDLVLQSISLDELAALL